MPNHTLEYINVVKENERNLVLNLGCPQRQEHSYALFEDIQYLFVLIRCNNKKPSCLETDFRARPLLFSEMTTVYRYSSRQ